MKRLIQSANAEPQLTGRRLVYVHDWSLVPWHDGFRAGGRVISPELPPKKNKIGH